MLENHLRPVAIAAALAAIAATLSGCSGFQSTASSPIAQTAHLAGTVHGGQQPVTGASIYLYAAGTGGYGSASSSLLNPTSPGVSVDASNHGYVTTDATGSFTITNDYTCPSSNPETYVLAVGGNPGLLPASINNSAITLVAALGPCSNLNSSTQVFISEVSTAAAVTALQQFMVDTVHLGAPASNLQGITNAFASVPNLVTLATSTARTINVVGSGAVPQAKINTIADILAPCVNSASPASTPCASLFAAATPTGGTAPAEVTGAMLSIAKNPISKVSTLYGLIDSNAPFQPTLTSAPNDFTVGITYSGGGLISPGDVVIDGFGNAWTANCPNCPTGPGNGTDSIVGFSPQGVLLTGTTGFTSNIHLPQGLAIDEENDIWSTNLNNGTLPDQITRFFSTGGTAPGFPFSGSALGTPLGIAIDSTSNAWVTNQALNDAVKISPSGALAVNNVTSTNFSAPIGIGIDGQGFVFAAGGGSSSILKFNSSGTVLSGSGAGYTGGGISAPISIAIDNADHVWSLNNQTNAVSEINGTNGSAVAPSTGYPGGYQVAVIAIDGAGTVWFANCKAGCPGSGGTGPDNVTHLDASGNLLNTSNGYQDTHFNGVGVAAIDGSGNLWVSNSAGGSLTQLLGVAAPVVTPLAVASANNQLGIKP